MKKKIIIASATVLFAVVNLFNMNLLQGNSLGDVSLDAIAVMAQAQAESGGGGKPYCYLIHVGWQNGVPLIRCGQTGYEDPSGVECDCWLGTRPLY